MLFFSKKKPILKDTIPQGYVDIHSHLLAGIDDGAKNFSDTLTLTQHFLNWGVTEIITTPHVIQHIWENTKEGIIQKQNETIIALEKNDLQLPFKAAAEYLMDDSFVKLFQTNKLLTLKDNYVLVEMSYLNPPIQLYNILFDLKVAGYIPVLAHPERYLFYHNNFEEYLKLKKAGCLFQLNLLSVVGYYGTEIAKIADKLLEKGWYDFVGSDVHHLNHIAAFDLKIKIKNTISLKETIANNQFFRMV
ncbi:tyrosine-protein phosphatase [Flavobacterium agrisoli]|uniref:protein-tyrosine-phosphatase n=1 Tax=Flavobacterium agrisoli TaxID=2793066 RepID=A0A934UL51_9FLAO|nr:CpsB/CapC family capsule biosynthesis tyrosine phosphatase [Flavobacterium agrisoli]MBK0371253.1 histidinol phosphatase [Flavobacterium agrisoli]